MPTPLVSREMAQGADINVVLTTEAVPHIAVSLTPGLDPGLVTRIQQALIKADKTEQGKAMLQKIGFPKFDTADAKIYNGQANILQKFWGF
jgi:ABC-type phosphate/phosphonate transport system substrate-binding protein